MNIPDNVMPILNESTIVNGVLILPPGQLERKLYESVNKCLEAMGGKWNRKAKGHTFDRDPSELLENALRTGEVIDAKKEFQFFATPPELARRMVKTAEIEPYHSVLEPSAGTGNILRAIGNQPNKVAVEINPIMVERLILCALSGLHIHQADFLTWNGGLELFDRVVMNPPFSRNQDIAHVSHAYTFLKPGGRLVAIMSEHSFFANDKASKAFRDCSWTLASEKLPVGTFDSSGTGVSSRMVVIQKASR